MGSYGGHIEGTAYVSQPGNLGVRVPQRYKGCIFILVGCLILSPPVQITSPWLHFGSPSRLNVYFFSLNIFPYDHTTQCQRPLILTASITIALLRRALVAYLQSISSLRPLSGSEDDNLSLNSILLLDIFIASDLNISRNISRLGTLSCMEVPGIIIIQLRLIFGVVDLFSTSLGSGIPAAIHNRHHRSFVLVVTFF